MVGTRALRGDRTRSATAAAWRRCRCACRSSRPSPEANRSDTPGTRRCRSRLCRRSTGAEVEPEILASAVRRPERPRSCSASVSSCCRSTLLAWTSIASVDALGSDRQRSAQFERLIAADQAHTLQLHAVAAVLHGRLAPRRGSPLDPLRADRELRQVNFLVIGMQHTCPVASSSRVFSLMFVVKSSVCWSYVVVAVDRVQLHAANLDERRVARRFHARLGELEFGDGRRCTGYSGRARCCPRKTRLLPFRVPLAVSDAALPVSVPSITAPPPTPSWPASCGKLRQIDRVDVIFQIGVRSCDRARFGLTRWLHVRARDVERSSCRRPVRRTGHRRLRCRCATHQSWTGSDARLPSAVMASAVIGALTSRNREVRIDGAGHVAVELLARGELPGVEPVEAFRRHDRSALPGRGEPGRPSSGSVPPMKAESVKVPDASSFIVDGHRGGSSVRRPGE